MSRRTLARWIWIWGWRSHWWVRRGISNVAERLRNAKFVPDKNDGKPTRQRWRISDPPVTVDFLIEPEQSTEAQAGRLFNLTSDWAAIIAPGLHLAFKNNQFVILAGQTIAGETVGEWREVRVCGAGRPSRFKALAFHIRGENKDAYDLFYLLRNYGGASQTWQHNSAPCSQTPARRKRWIFAR